MKAAFMDWLAWTVFTICTIFCVLTILDCAHSKPATKDCLADKVDGGFSVMCR